jgi:hypothetical protein
LVRQRNTNPVLGTLTARYRAQSETSSQLPFRYLDRMARHPREIDTQTKSHRRNGGETPPREVTPIESNA